MDAETKEIENRREEIENQLELLFKTNMKITGWDVPEVNDQRAAELLVEVLQNKLHNIRKDVAEGKYQYY
jgi:hypothetical protein